MNPSKQSLTIEDPIIKEIQNRTQVCFQCHTCIAGCPVFKAYPAFQPAKIAQELFFNKSVPVLNDIPAFWYCSTCYTCEAKCPQKVDLTHIFFELKNWAVANKVAVPKGIIKEASTMKEGVTAGVSQNILNRRKKLGLPELPPANKEEIEKILEASKFTMKLNSLMELEVEQ